MKCKLKLQNFKVKVPFVFFVSSPLLKRLKHTIKTRRLVIYSWILEHLWFPLRTRRLLSSFNDYWGPHPKPPPFMWIAPHRVVSTFRAWSLIFLTHVDCMFVLKFISKHIPLELICVTWVGMFILWSSYFPISKWGVPTYDFFCVYLFTYS